MSKMWEYQWWDEHNDERMIYALPSEHDFKYKLDKNFITGKEQLKAKHNKHKEPKTIFDYPENLRGESQNKWGGHKATNLKTFPQSKTPHGRCRTYTNEEIKAVEQEMRERGELG